MLSQTWLSGRPERLGPYRFDRLLGTGGMGTVWRAWDERLERWVALKQIRADVTLRHGRERLRREARAAARLNHPAIVHVYDIVEEEDGDWIVMELVEGRTLRRLLDEQRSLPPDRAIQIGREIAEALAEAHAHGILHRDLKANNVIVTASGRAKIFDFGLAKELPHEGATADQDLTASNPGFILGTCFAMSPEQVLGLPLDERSDLFSLGSLLYEMVTGEVPFRDETPALSLAKVVQGQLPPLQKSHPALPEELCDLVDWLLQKDMRDRPQSAAAVVAALETAAGLSGHWVAPAVLQVPQRAAEPIDGTLVERPIASAGRQPSEGARRQSGERRTVTIACCTLARIGSPGGEAGGLEIEALSEAMTAFESLGREICQRLSGSWGAVLGRTLWLCFGYPQAHEDDAERAVRAARELQESFAALPDAIGQQLAVRAGVHTGPAVVMPRPSIGTPLQPGDTLDIAMAIQGQVPAGRIGMSAASRRLLGRRYTTQPLADVYLRDLGITVALYELGSSVDPGSQPELLPPLVNREAEIHILLDRFRLARSGEGQAVLISGEAGIGKSRLVRALLERLDGEAPVWLTAYSSAFAQNTPLFPIVHLLARSLFRGTEESGAEKLRRLEEVLGEHGLPCADHAPFLGALLSLPVDERYPPLVLSPEARRKRTLGSILALVGAMAERHPLVLVIEDLHWIDPSTLDLLDLLLREIPVLPLLLVATFRPELTVPWRHQTSITQLSLSGLSQDHTAQLIERVAEGRRLPAETQREIVARTDGIPLFVEELTKTVLEADTGQQEPAAIPFTLDGSLLARLDRLGEAKAVAQLAAVIGRTFSVELLEALSWIKGAALRAALSQLLQAEIVHRRGPALGGRYVFKHALIQDAAYLSLLASDRQQLHRQLAFLLQEAFPAVAGEEPELMAHHCERGGLTVEAVEHLQKAGRGAMQRSALREAVQHLSRALDLLLGLPATPERSERELSLRSVLAAVFGAVKGWGASEVGVNAHRCAALCRELGDRRRLISSLYCLCLHHSLLGDRQATIDLADEIARLAETSVQVFIGCTARMHAAFYCGHFAKALALTEQAAALYKPNLLPEFAQSFGEESSLIPSVYRFWALWIVGKPDTAVREQEAVLAAVEALRSPLLLGLTLLFEMFLSRELRSPERVEKVSARLLALAREQGFALPYALAHCGQGWAACQRGDVERGTELIHTGLDLYSAGGTRLLGYNHSYLVEAHLLGRRPAEGLAATRDILTRIETGLSVFFTAEILRLQGELQRLAGDDDAAEADFRKALDIARGQGAHSFELRTAVSLGRLLIEQGRTGEALPPLAAAYQAFDEGFATRDLVEARELLDSLDATAKT